MWLESIRTEKGQIDTKNANLPQVESYAEFWNVLTNQKKEAIYTKVDNLGEITIVRDSSNNPNTPESNKYTIQKEQMTTTWKVQVQLCYVVGKHKMESFLSQYVRNDIKNYKEIVQIQINEDAEKAETIVASQQELGTLADEITDYDYTPEGIKAYFKNANMLHKDIQKDYDATLRLIKDRQKNKNKPTLLEKNMLTLLEHKHTKDIRNIEQLEKTVANLCKEYRKDTNVDTRKENAKQTHLQLLYYRSQGQKLSTILHNESAQKNFVDNPDTYMDIPVESSQDALLLKVIYDNMSKERFRINELLTDANFKNIKDKNGQTMQEYLNATLEDGATAKEAFVPSSEYQDEYNEVLKNYPQLHEWMKKDPTDARTNTEPTSTGNITPNGQEIYNNPEYIAASSRWGLLDKLAPSQLTDIIDKQNWQPQTKEGFKTAAWIVMLGMAWFLAWKTVTNIFKEDKDKDKWRGRYVAWAALLFGWSAISSGGNFLNFKSLSKDIGNRFSSSPDNIPGNEKNTTPEKETAWGLESVMLVFGGMKSNAIQSMTINENGRLKIDYKKAKDLITANKSNISNADQRIKMIETLEKSPNQNLIPIAFDAVGITSEKLKNNPSATFDELAEKWLTNFVVLADYMAKNKYSKRNPELKDYIYKYMRWDSSYNLDKLAKMWAFEKDETLPTSPDALKNNIQALTTLKTDQEKQELYLQAYKIFNELKNNTHYTGELKFTEANGVLYLETYNNKTAIDIASKKIGNIPLYTTYQTIKAANLTNRMQDIFRGKSDTDKPFNIWLVWTDIEFQKNSLNSTEGWKNIRQFAKDKFDTEAVAAWRGGTLKDIAPSLEDNKQAYVDYLNALPWRKK